MARPDEVFQALEPAHRLWSGWGVETWEWREGIRSWLFPGFLAGLIQLSAWAGLGTAGYLAVIAVVLSLVSLGVVVSGVVLGWRSFGLAGAVLGGTLCAFWPDLVFYAPKTLGEVQGGNLLVVAAALATVAAAQPGMPPRRMAMLCGSAGLLLGLVICLRFQLAPAVLATACWAARRHLRTRWLPLAAGAAVPLAALGLVDWLTWGVPFQSIVKNFAVNAVQGRSGFYGTYPPLWYLSSLTKMWGAALLPVLLFFVIGVRHAPLLALTAGLTLISHMLIPHKEMSFVYAALPAALIVAALGTARAVNALPDLLAKPLGCGVGLRAAVGLWICVCASTASVLAFYWRGAGVDMLPLWIDARARADLCGVGIVGPVETWSRTGGYAYLGRQVPIAILISGPDLAAGGPSVNYLVGPAMSGEAPAGYGIVRCIDDYCLMRREGPCAPLPPALEITARLRANDM